MGSRSTLREPPIVKALLMAAAFAYIALMLLLPLWAVMSEAFRAGAKAWAAAVTEPDASAAIKLTLLVAAIVVVPEWNRSLLSSGAYKYAPALRGPDLATALTAGELVSYREGSTGTVAVRRLTGTTSLAIDGKVDGDIARRLEA